MHISFLIYQVYFPLIINQNDFAEINNINNHITIRKVEIMSSILKSLDAIMSSLTKEQYRPYLEAYKGKMKDPLSDFPNYESDFIGISDLDELDDWLYDSVPHTELGDEIFRVVETTLKKIEKIKN